jgi:hypothetical protein
VLELAAILDQHRIWVESGGEAGSKADLCGADLENADFTGANLQGAFLQRANLRGADLSMANLRHASLVQADLSNANLLGTEFRGANLMGATLYGAEGLWLGRLGGANLYDAMLPETISSIDGAKAVWETTKSASLVLFLDAHRVHALRIGSSYHQRRAFDSRWPNHSYRASRQHSSHERFLLDCAHRLGGPFRALSVSAAACVEQHVRSTRGFP